MTKILGGLIAGGLLWLVSPAVIQAESIGSALGSAPWRLAQSIQSQTTTVYLDASQLSRPHELRISTTGNLGGQVKVGNTIVRYLNGRESWVNLAPYLRRGRNVVEISGSYAPAQGSISLELKAPGQNVVQQSSGNGRLRHTLILDVD
ncbi:hypothetical protein GS597_16890 [Synechococcales cyanobacterium C]|uniref:Uncharacterized protein n=1 Tax=Petrachloros mirabilis ULC683 TaxID=2781853 RepID=A0A8K2A1V2_9CYAN|nr:hypothetical protein [Petrachloros mirabilis]NCJ08153.1 hypothetical protein [Petrachloros mirabilis ULC683]